MRRNLTGTLRELELLRDRINAARGYPRLADVTCQRGGGIHVPLDIAHTYSACEPSLDADTRVWTLRVDDSDYSEVIDVKRIVG